MASIQGFVSQEREKYERMVRVLQEWCEYLTLLINRQGSWQRKTGSYMHVMKSFVKYKQWLIILQHLPADQTPMTLVDNL